MERKMRNQILDEIMELVAKLRDEESVSAPTASKPMEMLTVKEAAALVNGVSVHTIRKLVAQDNVHYIRTGEGERGKILISKESLLAYLNGMT